MTASVLGFDSKHHFMNPGYGSPSAALFGAVPQYMDYYPGMQMYPSPGGVADQYAGSLFADAPAAPGAAGYMHQSPPSQGGLGASEDIRTVFISGLPHDVKERELHNLLRFMPGYEASQMNWKTGGPQGFALFSTGAHARAMVDILSGLQFDDGVLLRAEMAHKNMFIKVNADREDCLHVLVFAMVQWCMSLVAASIEACWSQPGRLPNSAAVGT